jgi:RNA polymerase sigma factor (sigma-70 family)
MADATLRTVLCHLRRLGAARPGDHLSDRQLLDAFLRRRDESAFAALLARHGPMVLGVCRRVLRHEQDADDAFQATFLVLVRRGASVRGPDSLGSWLYGVALRTARHARLDAARRRRREERAAASPLCESPDDVDWRDLRAVLDEEIAGLPESYREPLVLCHLEGQTNAQAARRLRVPLGSLSKRLARARGLLRGRLLRRGLTLSAAALLTVLGGQSGAAVPPALARATTGTALLALAGGAAPAAVAALADGIGHALLPGPVKGWLLGLAVVGVLLGGGYFAGWFAPAPSSGGDSAWAAPVVPVQKEPPRDEPPESAEKKPPRAEPPARDRKDLDAIKQRLLSRGGGNAKSEAAVAAGLLWLVKQQTKDGHWALEDAGGQKNDIAGTAFGLLPLLGAGHTHHADKGPFTDSVRRGLDFLVARQKKDGDFGGGMYAQALASRALFQAYVLTGDPKLAAPAGSALDFIVQAQHDAGGWRYTPRSAGDLSVTAWQVAALHDARAAGLDVPQKALDAAARFVATCRAPGGYTYLPAAGTATQTMTAAGLFAASDLGARTEEDHFREGVGAVAKGDPPAANSYQLHWAAEVLARHGGADWKGWNAKMRDGLVERQKADGSFSAEGDLFGPGGGRVMVTSLSLLALEVYYRDELLFAANPARLRTDKEVEAAWSDLAGADPIKARRSVWALARSPREALSVLDKSLTPPAPPAADAKKLARLIADLDDDRFDVRESATKELEKLGKAAEPALRGALKGQPSAEARRRLEALLSGLEGRRYTPEHRRLLRAVEVLEQIGTAEAQRVLERVAKEWPEDDLARAAEAALRRLLAQQRPSGRENR